MDEDDKQEYRDVGEALIKAKVRRRLARYREKDRRAKALAKAKAGRRKGSGKGQDQQAEARGEPSSDLPAQLEMPVRPPPAQPEGIHRAVHWRVGRGELSEPFGTHFILAPASRMGVRTAPLLIAWTVKT